ncbi:MAG: (E)-4-hydroxy-3-methylbut-2-enyl-diphosphate synthase [Bacteroidales bacterium]|nr:(E)-4-hydroxy-3-methylbut-2-enyl-diphosphate synthase [Bacteroidales bacterium]
MENYKYCVDINQYKRFKTREVKIGNIPVGGNNPIRLQSMTTTNTLDTQASVEQCIRIFDAGADYVRLTAQSTRHADNLANIKKDLVEKGYSNPIIADIHFNPKVAEVAADLVEKVRVNPGNFVDRKNGKEIETEEEYQEGLNKIEEQFTRLIDICKKNSTAIRIGCNHGSLSSRIVNKYGDTVEGMAQSVLEFLRIARKNNFHEIVISLKASNTRVMVYAYRLLMNKMIAEEMNYPLHLGVTEAGDGEDGRIKSAIGIGTLLADGIGDTVRVSLTEDPEFEIPVAKKIVSCFSNLDNHDTIYGTQNLIKHPYDYAKRETFNTAKIGSEKSAVVIADLSANISIVDADIINLGFKLNDKEDWDPSDNSPDYIFIGEAMVSTDTTHGLKFIAPASEWEDKINMYPLFPDIQNYIEHPLSSKMNFISVKNEQTVFENLLKIKNDDSVVLMLESDNKNVVADQRAFMQHLLKNNLKFPVVLRRNYQEPDFEQFQIKSACDTGALLIDGYIDGIMLNNSAEKNCMKIVNTSFGILQASRTRMTKTEYISCPSCGRTLFEIQKVTEKIKKRTGHLKGLKIAVMGCIVNGPGEMADADYGYVGAGAGKVSLYKGKEVVKKNIASENALDDLVQLIKNKGDWKEPV